ncbi:MAG: SPFH domain-containing protein [Myxococcales bacterium]|nr:SPFH domain-containing protein [Myxococcales bacterium]
MTDAKRERLVRYSRIYVIALGCVLMARACLLTEVEAGTVGVRYNNAFGLHKQDLKPGFHLEVSGLHRVWRLPSNYLQIRYTQQDVFSIRTKDNNTVQVDVSIPYRIKPGQAWKVMDAGNHLPAGPGIYRFQRFAEETATSVLRENLAQLRSEDFYHTDRRLEVANQALKTLNKKLAPYHLEARTVLVRATYFRSEYETQLAKIQFNEQQKLLDGAKRAVAEKQQDLDNFEQQTNAMISAKEQDWAQRIANLDRAYQVGFIDTGVDRTPGAARAKLGTLDATERDALEQQASDVFSVGRDRITEAHLLGIKNVQAETTEYTQRVVAEADSISNRLTAEGQAKVATLRGAYEARVNQLLGSPAGRAYVAYNVADKVGFAKTLTFQSDDGIPSVLRLGDFARQLMGR